MSLLQLPQPNLNEFLSTDSENQTPLSWGQFSQHLKTLLREPPSDYQLDLLKSVLTFFAKPNEIHHKMFLWLKRCFGEPADKEFMQRFEDAVTHPAFHGFIPKEAVHTRLQRQSYLFRFVVNSWSMELDGSVAFVLSYSSTLVSVDTQLSYRDQKYFAENTNFSSPLVSTLIDQILTSVSLPSPPKELFYMNPFSIVSKVTEQNQNQKAKKNSQLPSLLLLNQIENGNGLQSSTADFWSLPMDVIGVYFLPSPVSLTIVSQLRLVSKRWYWMCMKRLLVSYTPYSFATAETFIRVLQLFQHNIISLDLRSVAELLPQHLLELNWNVLRTLKLSTDGMYALAPLLEAVPILQACYSASSLRSLCLSPSVFESIEQQSSMQVPFTPFLRSWPFHLRNELQVPASVSALTILMPLLMAQKFPGTDIWQLPPTTVGSSSLKHLTVNFPVPESIYTSLSSFGYVAQSQSRFDSFSKHANYTHLETQAYLSILPPARVPTLHHIRSVVGLCVNEYSPFNTIQAFLSAASNLQSLHLIDVYPSNQCLSFDRMVNLPRLTDLTLFGVFKTVPIGWQQNLTRLSIRSTQYSNELLAQLTFVKALEIHGTQSLPKELPILACFTQLEHLALHAPIFNDYERSIPDRLRSLSLSSDDASDYSMCFTKLTQLETLRCAGRLLNAAQSLTLPRVCNIRTIFVGFDWTIAFESLPRLRCVHFHFADASLKSAESNAHRLLDSGSVRLLEARFANPANRIGLLKLLRCQSLETLVVTSRWHLGASMRTIRDRFPNLKFLCTPTETPVQPIPNVRTFDLRTLDLHNW